MEPNQDPGPCCVRADRTETGCRRARRQTIYSVVQAPPSLQRALGKFGEGRPSVRTIVCRLSPSSICQSSLDSRSTRRRRQVDRAIAPHQGGARRVPARNRPARPAGDPRSDHGSGDREARRHGHPPRGRRLAQRRLLPARHLVRLLRFYGLSESTRISRSVGLAHALSYHH